MVPLADGSHARDEGDAPRRASDGPTALCARCARCGWLDRVTDRRSHCDNCGVEQAPESAVAGDGFALPAPRATLRAPARSVLDAPPSETWHPPADPIAARLHERLLRAGLEPRAHAIAVARAVLASPRDGVAILCDPVRAGTHIAAALVGCELASPGGVLVLAPAARLDDFRATFGSLARPDVVLARLAQAARPGGLQRSLCARPWDLVIVDQAHSLGDTASASHALVRRLERTHVLVLSPTPARDARALDAVAALLRPGLAEARSLLVRAVPHDRAPTVATRRGFALEADERALYDALAALARHAPARGLLRSIRALERLAAASPGALASALERLALRKTLGAATRARLVALAAQARATRPASRLRALADVLGNGRAVVFTRYRASLDAITSSLGARAVGLHRALGVDARRDAIARIASGASDVMVCTDAAAIGLDAGGWRVVHFDPPASASEARRRVAVVVRSVTDGAPVDEVALVALGTVESRSYARLARDERLLASLLDDVPVAAFTSADATARVAIRRAIPSDSSIIEPSLRAADGAAIAITARADRVRVERAVVFAIEDRNELSPRFVTVFDDDRPGSALELDDGVERFEQLLRREGVAAATDARDAEWLDCAGQRALGAPRERTAEHGALADAATLRERVSASVARAPRSERDELRAAGAARLRELGARARGDVALDPIAFVALEHPERHLTLELRRDHAPPITLALVVDLATGVVRAPPCAACGTPLTARISACELARHALCGRCTDRSCVACARSRAR